MAIRSSSWSKHVHRHTVEHPAGNYCNPHCIGGQDCLTTDDSDTERSTFGSHIHRGSGTCCHMCVHTFPALHPDLDSALASQHSVTNINIELQSEQRPSTSRRNARPEQPSSSPSPLSPTNLQHEPPLQLHSPVPLLRGLSTPSYLSQSRPRPAAQASSSPSAIDSLYAL